MTTQYSKCGNFKLENGSLYELTKDSTGGECWMHCALTEKKRVSAAVKEYQNSEKW